MKGIDTGIMDEPPVKLEIRNGISFVTAPMTEDTEVTGPSMLLLWVSSTLEDMDIFVTLRNVGPDGRDVWEVGQQGLPVPLTKGWLRASHRKLDAERSLPYRPYHAWNFSVWRAGTAAMALAGAVTLSHAQQSAWRPERSVEIVLPSAAGSSLDAGARFIQKILQDARIVDVPVLVLNKAGGAGTIATAYLEQRAGDGHFLFNSTMSLMNNHILGRAKTNYTDYTPIALLYSEHMTVVVPANSPLKSARDIRDKLKSDPQALSVAIGFAPGRTNHLNIALLMTAMGIDVKKLKTVVCREQGKPAAHGCDVQADKGGVGRRGYGQGMIESRLASTRGEYPATRP